MQFMPVAWEYKNIETEMSERPGGKCDISSASTEPLDYPHSTSSICEYLGVAVY